jgi:hypothetical protein
MMATKVHVCFKNWEFHLVTPPKCQKLPSSVPKIAHVKFRATSGSLSTTLWCYYRGQNQVVVMNRCFPLVCGCYICGFLLHVEQLSADWIYITKRAWLLEVVYMWLLASCWATFCRLDWHNKTRLITWGSMWVLCGFFPHVEQLSTDWIYITKRALH